MSGPYRLVVVAHPGFSVPVGRMGPPDPTLLEFTTRPNYLHLFCIGDVVSIDEDGYPIHARPGDSIAGIVYGKKGIYHPAWWALYQR